MNQRKMNDVPIIDINQDRQTAVAEISKACTQWGFFKISNHGISEKLIDNMYGSIVKVNMDNSHPLAFGYQDSYYALKMEKKLYPLLPKGWNVGILKNSESHIAGFMGNRIKKKIKNNLMFGVYEAKSGRIIYIADNPIFRSFWYNGKLLFGNAVFIVGK